MSNRGMDMDGPFFRGLEIIANLMVLNFLVIICSVPVFTAGAAFTALHKQLYRMRTNEEGYIVRGFFKEFKASFKQSTQIWLGILAVGAILGLDVYIFMEKGLEFEKYYKIGIYAIIFTAAITVLYVFPIIARYETTNKNVIKNAMAMAFAGFFKSIIMLAVTVAPWVAACFVANFVLLDMLFGISIPAYICVFLYHGTFKYFEKKQAEAQEEMREQEDISETDEEENDQ